MGRAAKRPDPPQESRQLKVPWSDSDEHDAHDDHLLRPAPLFGLALSAVALVRPAQALDDEVTADQKFMRGIMEGLGLQRDGEEMINYRERSPLVIPPSRALPLPERSDAAIANNPAWPKDPDQERRKAQAAMEKGRNVSDEREREQNPLRPDQLTPGGRAKKKQVRTDDGYEPPATGL
jgi:hypothetical protein